VTDYLERYAAQLDVEIQTNTRVETISRTAGCSSSSPRTDGCCRQSGIVAASGSFSNPFRPRFPGEDTFVGSSRTSRTTATRHPYAGRRVVVVGAGDSAAQVANELSPVATTSLATRHPVRFIPQRLGGRDIHYWLRETGFDTLPAVWLSKLTDGAVVTDSVGFRQTLAQGASINVRCSRRSTEARWSGVMANANRSTRSSSLRDTDPVCTTCASSGSRRARSSDTRRRNLVDARWARLCRLGVPALLCF